MQRYPEQIMYRDEKGSKRLLAKLAKRQGLRPSELIRMAVAREIKRLTRVTGK